MKNKIIGFLLGLVGIFAVIIQSMRLDKVKTALKRSQKAREAESKAHRAIIKAKQEGRDREQQINTAMDRDYFNNTK